ncbi:hypothetical protein NHX12_019374 [Muraenolepis orangiensis]|uniref:Ankyrin repeat domain-containing protein 6-like n=1 Tax=Muraenolepis orangiensis TaxID=630683 RepID=A0A9Q0ITU0_9TELE|nr:hypothetical protein NHX12_019374 [Muraenolepis orangiensis]
MMVVAMSEPASKSFLWHHTRPCLAQGPQTALHRAAAMGNSDAMASLVQGGCALDLKDRDGNTALHEVSWHGFYKCVKLLVKAGADVHARNKAGSTPLHLACQNAHAQSAHVLLLGGSTPDTKNNMGDTCLHVASRYNHLKVLKILLSALCSVTETNEEGDTALHTAAALNHKKTVQLLLEAGADRHVQNNAGRTALDKARDNNNKEVAVVLARAPQGHRFMQGRTIRKRRERRTAEPRTQSLTRVDMLAKKESALSADDIEPDGGQRDAPEAILATGRRCYHHRRRKLGTVTGRRPHSPRRGAMDEDHAGGGEADLSGIQRRKGHLLSGDSREPQKAGAYQLYTLYRDRDGAPASECHCRPLFRKLEDQIQATQGEMKWHMGSFQDQIHVQLARMHRRNRRQIKVLDMLNQERAATERGDILHSIDQQAKQGREQTLRSQAAVSRDLKRWCVSQMRDMDLPLAEACLLESPLPLLALVPGDSSSSSLATYVNVFPMERSPEDYENAALLPLSTISSADPYWRPPGVVLHRSVAPPATVGLGRSGGGSSSSSSREEAETPRNPSQREGRSYGRPHGRRLSEPGVDRFFMDRPVQPTFTQERNHLHAMEVTQRFFETVSTQLERWYERKVQEAKRQTELRAQQDTEQLLHRITALEEELQRLTPNHKTEST